MVKKSFYKRGWHHTKTRGRESLVSCGFCGRRVPKYKTFSVARSFRINDPLLKNQMGYGKRPIPLLHSKMYACPACARHRSIVRKKR
jgi:ribosomal protein S26